MVHSDSAASGTTAFSAYSKNAAGQAKSRPRQQQTKSTSYTEGRLNLFRVLMGNCYNCEPTTTTAAGLMEGLSPTIQFVELHGICFIGLGCMADELTPRERVYDTLEQLTDRSERLLSIGHVVVDKSGKQKRTHTVPLDVWTKSVYDDDDDDGLLARSSSRKGRNPLDSLARPVKNLVEQIKNKDYESAAWQLGQQLSAQRKNLDVGNNRYLAGITAHNLAVVKILSGDDDSAVVTLFEEAIELKSMAYGKNHPEVAYSWDELGIQLFAREQFNKALTAFENAQKVRRHTTPRNNADGPGGEGVENRAGSGNNDDISDVDAGGMAMVLNNIACCNFQLKQFKSALLTLQEARRILQQHHNHAIMATSSSGSSSTSSADLSATPNHPHANNMAASRQVVDLDLLYNAIVMCNCGYLHLCLKLYDDARSLFEEALLIQQSVLDDNHRAIRDTRSNLEFTNAFHL